MMSLLCLQNEGKGILNSPPLTEGLENMRLRQQDYFGKVHVANNINLI
jgi:hypothetical protein